MTEMEADRFCTEMDHFEAEFRGEVAKMVPKGLQGAEEEEAAKSTIKKIMLKGMLFAFENDPEKVHALLVKGMLDAMFGMDEVCTCPDCNPQPEKGE